MSASLNALSVGRDSSDVDDYGLCSVAPANLKTPTVNQEPFELDDHGLRSAHYVRLLARRLRDMGQYTEVLSDAWIEMLCQAAPLHDIGKAAIPDHILLQDGKLSQADWCVVQTHAQLGEAILHTTAAQLEYPSEVLKLAIIVAGSHHEKWDGKIRS